MITNYLKLAVRLMTRNTFTTIINACGLTVGYATFLLLWPYADAELKSDQYHPDADRIVRLGVDFKWTDDGKNWNGLKGAFNGWGVAYEISKTLPQVEAMTRIVPQLDYVASQQGTNSDLHITILNEKDGRVIYRETETIFAEANLFSFFEIPLIEGDKNSVLKDANTVVLSQTTAEKYFGDKAPVGQTIYLNDSIPMKVTGVFKNLPHNTHLRFDMIFSVAGKKDVDVSKWNHWTGYCYFKLRPGYDIKQFQTDLDQQKDKLYSYAKYTCAHCDLDSLLQSLSEVVFSDLRDNAFNSKSKYLIEILYVVAFLVLILGWINYTTLSVHMLNKRLSELAARRVVGARNRELAAQFLVESVALNLMAFLAALTIFQVLRTPLETWLGIYVPAWSLFPIEAYLMLGATFAVGVGVTTLYPLSVIWKKSLTDLTKKSNQRLRHTRLSTALVTIQYLSAFVLLIWILTSNLQVNHILNKDIGLKKDGIIVIEGPVTVIGYNDSKLTSFLQQTNETPGVEGSTRSYSLLGEIDNKGLMIKRTTESNFVGVDSNGGVDESFLKTFDIPLLAGRNFLADNPADEKTILASLALVQRLGFPSPEAALGQHIQLPEINVNTVEIVGVFRDYEFRPFFSDVSEPGRGVALLYKDHIVHDYKPLRIAVRINPEMLESIIPRLETAYKSLFPSETFRWYWLDDKVAEQYVKEKAAKNQISFFTVLAVFISCLGLLGLISNKAIEKNHEIGIRKVLGAGGLHVANVLLNTTLRQVLLSIVAGIPLAYYLTDGYLQKFSERITLHWWHFILPAAIFLAVMLLVISSVLRQAMKTNPVEALKHE